MTRDASFRSGVGFLLSRVARLAEREWALFLTRAGLSQAEFTVLSVLAELGPMRQREVAERAVVDPRNAVATVARLTGRDLVANTADPVDRRGKILAVTSTGEQVLTEAGGHLAAERGRFLAALSPTERDVLANLLGRVYQAHTAPSASPASSTSSTAGFGSAQGPDPTLGCSPSSG